MYSYPTEGIQQYNKETANSQEVESIPQVSIFHRLYIEQQIPRPVDKNRRYVLFRQEEKRDILYKESNHG